MNKENRKAAKERRAKEREHEAKVAHYKKIWSWAVFCSIRLRSSAVTGQRRMMGRFRFTIGWHRPFCIRVWGYPNKQFCI